MRYTLLGDSGLRVSELALGTMTFGTDWGWGATEADAAAQVEMFAEAGGNLIDTANRYTEGTAEKYVGAAIRGDRDRWVVATKYTLFDRADDPNAAGNQRKNLMRSLEASLRRLGTDYVDVLFVHAWDGLTPVEEVVRGLDDVVRAGKAHYVGFSDTPAWVAARAQTLAQKEGRTPFSTIQVPYSLAERTVERELVPMARSLGMGVMGWAPLAGGLLSGKYVADGRAATGAVDSRRSAKELSPDRLALAVEVARVAEAVGASSSQVALAWLLSRGVIPIIGARTPGQLRDNLGCLDVELPEELLAGLDKVSRVSLGFPVEFLGSMSDLVLGPGMEQRLDARPAWR
ncbi:aldo/keto reductase [Actinorugispora endophytica]|uniref:Aryl-alcohol dehydrogenase-like predicted oxidoreductase n=1 Tax=Actinorugispora endophytica TaxID=1605990 RepID=A0A4R6UL64_9ACTN|nr:aldo/keto reductase [Actinorugispora endophytica]TDQ46906.1 aryl-alcohol dehydrogenase-like predicted oxidoreductase [Actinorugispora endophytica]